MDIVGGGRLAGGVKKGWLIGGKRPGSEERSKENRQGKERENSEGDGDGVRIFSVEWAGM